MKKILLDTHTILWFFNDDDALSLNAKTVILDPFNNICVSMASVWEVAIKISLKKLVFDGGVQEFVRLIEENGFELLPITPEHIFELEQLPYIHRDPFDRMLVTTAKVEKMCILTKDKNIMIIRSYS
jgi:PIN domain nuclease of toxin-antitoxin system